MAGLLMKQIVLWSISPGHAVVRSAAPFRWRSDREKQLSLAYRGQVYRAIIEGPERQIGVFVNYTGHRGPKEYIVLTFSFQTEETSSRSAKYSTFEYNHVLLSWHYVKSCSSWIKCTT